MGTFTHWLQVITANDQMTVTVATINTAKFFRLRLNWPACPSGTAIHPS
jgi:hypothetical protein